MKLLISKGWLQRRLAEEVVPEPGGLMACSPELYEKFFKREVNVMHYKNGREAKNGDKVMVIPSYGPPYVGILYDAQAGNDYCNGKIAPISGNDLCPNLKECLHLDDALGALSEDIFDTSKSRS